MIQAVKRIPATLDEISVEQALWSFLLDCRTKNLSPQMVAWYEKRIKYLVEFLRNAYPQVTNFSLSLLTERDVKMFIQHLMERDHKRRSGVLSSYTVKGTVVSLKVFFSHLFDEGYLKENLAEKIKTPKVCRKIIQTFSVEQIRHFSARRTKKILQGSGITVCYLCFWIRVSV